MAAEPQTEPLAVRLFMDRLREAYEVRHATYSECVAYVFGSMLPRCVHTLRGDTDDLEVTLPGYGDVKIRAREYRIMLTLLAGLERLGVVVCLERMQVPQLMGVSRTWRLSVNTPEPRARKEAYEQH